jgi:predicted nucleic acid-binding protein
MRHYFLDTNVVIDYLAQRQPFWPDAAELMQAGVAGEAKLYVSSLSFTNIEYILRGPLRHNRLGSCYGSWNRW